LSDVNAETLQDLMERRLKELGQRRGRGEQISLHEAYDRMVEQLGKDADVPTYEVFRRIRTQGHSKITDRTADALATMLDVDVNEVLEAAGQRKRLGRFDLPRTADRLDEVERAAVLGVVDAILRASNRGSVVPLGKRDDMQQIQTRAARSTD
jgi:predicted DNA-binding protein